MKCSTGAWTIALTAALLGTPAAGWSQTSAPAPGAGTEAQERSPNAPAPTAGSTQPDAAGTSGTTTAQEARGAQAADTGVIRQHLTAARNALSELTQLPAAAQLAGETRHQVSQLISNFNELITTTTNWRAAHARVDANLLALLGPDEDAGAVASDAQPNGGDAGADLDPEVRGKLVEFRNHLKEFERASGGGRETGALPSDVATRASMTDPTVASGSTSTGAQYGTPGTLPADTVAGGEAGAATQGAPATTDQNEGLRHIEAIEALLDGQAGSAPAAPVGTAGGQQGEGGIDAAKVELIRTHLNELRRILETSETR